MVLPTKIDPVEVEERVRRDVLTLERTIHPECPTTFVSKYEEWEVPRARYWFYRLTGYQFVHSFMRLRFIVDVDRCGQEAGYYADFYRDDFRSGNHLSDIIVKRRGITPDTWYDHLAIRWHRFKTYFKDYWVWRD